jgi:hypothetical protein
VAGDKPFGNVGLLMQMARERGPDASRNRPEERWKKNRLRGCVCWTCRGMTWKGSRLLRGLARVESVQRIPLEPLVGGEWEKKKKARELSFELAVRERENPYSPLLSACSAGAHLCWSRRVDEERVVLFFWLLLSSTLRMGDQN